MITYRSMAPLPVMTTVLPSVHPDPARYEDRETVTGDRLAQLSLLSLAQGPRDFRLSSRPAMYVAPKAATTMRPDRKSTRLNSSHPSISYAVFCLKKKN